MEVLMASSKAACKSVSKSFQTTTTITLVEKQHKGLWQQNSLDWLTK